MLVKLQSARTGILSINYMSNVKSIKKTDGDKTLPKRNEDVTVIFVDSVYDPETETFNNESIVFPNMMGMSIGQHWVTITGEDNKSYVYPASRIREIQQVYKD